MADGAGAPGAVLSYIFEEGEIAEEFDVQLYTDDLVTGSGTLPLLLIALLDGKHLVAVPQEAWHRLSAKRRMMVGALSRAAPVEVLAADYLTHATLSPDRYIKCWVGFLRSDLLLHLQPLDEMAECECNFGVYEEKFVIPAVESLVAAANEHFVFFSAEEGESAEPAEILESPTGPPDVGSEELQARVKKIETTLGTLTAGVDQLLESARREKALTSTPKHGATFAPKHAVPGKESAFPHLDPSVVQAALQAGVPHANLAQMERLVGQNARAKKVKEIRSDVILDPLSEDEPVAVERDESGSPQGDRVADTLTKLTAIVELLAEDKKKARATSKLDLALDSAQGTLSSEGVTLGAAKKTAAARLALRATFQKHPEEVHQVVERLMYEDLSSQTLGPGQQPAGLNARSWVEFRSRITNHKTGAFASWAVAGILDALIIGNYSAARARACLALLQLDQASIDKGSWNLAAELSLEPGPPMSALGQHQGPNVSEGESPFSRLLDPRWAEVALGHLKDQEDYLAKRRTLGRSGARASKEEGEEGLQSDVRRRPKTKPKAKASSASEKAGDN